jgi:hypothetical protein
MTVQGAQSYRLSDLLAGSKLRMRVDGIPTLVRWAIRPTTPGDIDSGSIYHIKTTKIGGSTSHSPLFTSIETIVRPFTEI